MCVSVRAHRLMSDAGTGPVLVVTTQAHVIAHTGGYFAQYPLKVDSLGGAIADYKKHAVEASLCSTDTTVVLVKADGSIVVE